MWGLRQESLAQLFLEQHPGRACEPFKAVFYYSSLSSWCSALSAMLKYVRRERVSRGSSRLST
jgi:hypothetical protein